MKRKKKYGRRSMAAVALLISLFFMPQNAILSAADDVWPRVETRHFLVLAEPALQPAPMSLSDWNVALTQYIAQLDEKLAPLFGDQTLSPLQQPLAAKPVLLICADKRSYLAKLAEYGALPSAGAAAQSGGFYHPESNVIFTWRQPTDYYSRHVVLHEVAHWYCLQLLGERYAKMPLWLCEGLADFAATHTWDGQTLHAMRMPRVSLENYPARLAALMPIASQGDAANVAANMTPENIADAFGQLRKDGHDAENRGLVYDEYALAWGLVAFLIDEFPDETGHLCKSLAQHDAPESWQLAFYTSSIPDPPSPTWSRFADWVAENQLPWQWVWNHWEDDGRHLIGVSDSTALIVQSPQNAAETDTLHCTATPLLDGTVVGLVFRYENAGHFEMLQFRNATENEVQWRHVRFAKNEPQLLTPWRKTASTPENRDVGQEMELKLQRQTADDKEEIRIFYDSRLVVSLDDEQATKGLPFGLSVQSGAAKFEIHAD